jgi:DNA-binding NarL/FixJ family response regulator
MSCRVLIVEDNPQMQAALAGAVASAGDMELAGLANDVRTGLQLLEDRAPDVLLVDIGLPDGSGIQLIQWASKRLPECASLVVTVFADEASVIRCIEAGAVGYILKDASVADIAAQIRLVSVGGSPISPRIARQLLKRIGSHRDNGAGAADTSVTLSAQEHHVLLLSAKGYSYGEIAQMLELSRNTVETYVKRIYRKLQVTSKAEAVFEARSLGLLRD